MSDMKPSSLVNVSSLSILLHPRLQVFLREAQSITMARGQCVDSPNYCSGNRSQGSGRSSYAASSRPTSNGSQRPNYWRCCKCSGGWYSYQINDSCPMCQAWRCPNCEYSMS
ncbi:hypothetical protein V8C26DRAFT_400278 [Trichoderma gracile]